MFKRKATAMLLATLPAFAPFAWMPQRTHASEPNSDALFFVQDLFADNDFANSITAYAIETFGYDFMQNHNRSATMADVVLDIFAQDDIGMRSYPTNFGGVYIDDDGSLVILAASSPMTPMALTADPYAPAFAGLLGTATRMDAGISVREVDFAFAELMEAIEFLQDFLEHYPDIALRNVSTWYLDVIGNRVVVGLIDYSPQEIYLFRQDVPDSPVVVFREYAWESFVIDDEPFEPDVQQGSVAIEPFGNTWHPGGRIRVDGSIGGSIGYRARLIRSPSITGFVTAAHIGPANWGDPRFTGVPRIVRAQNNVTAIGDAVLGAVAFDGLDAAFIQNRGAHSVSNQLPANRYVSEPHDRFHAARYGNSVVGVVVFQYGTPTDQQTPSLISGRISTLHQLINLAVDRHGTFQVNVDRVDYTSPTAGGRSGGIVFRVIDHGPMHTTSFGVLGIHVAGALYQGFFVQAQRINARFGLELY